MPKIKVFYYLGEGGMGMCYSRLPKAQETLITVRTVLGECPSTGMEHSYLVPGSIILFKISLLSYILDGNRKEKQHIYIYKVSREGCARLQENVP
jgi:hypothetical protein